MLKCNCCIYINGLDVIRIDEMRDGMFVCFSALNAAWPCQKVTHTNINKTPVSEIFLISRNTFSPFDKIKFVNVIHDWVSQNFIRYFRKAINILYWKEKESRPERQPVVRAMRMARHFKQLFQMWGVHWINWGLLSIHIRMSHVNVHSNRLCALNAFKLVYVKVR